MLEQPKHKAGEPDGNDGCYWCAYCGQLVPPGCVGEPCPSIEHPLAAWWNTHGPQHRGWCMECTSQKELEAIGRG